MPFKSQKQIAKFAELVKQGKMSQAKMDQWLAETPDSKSLPERVSKPAKGLIGIVRAKKR